MSNWRNVVDIKKLFMDVEFEDDKKIGEISEKIANKLGYVVAKEDKYLSNNHEYDLEYAKENLLDVEETFRTISSAIDSGDDSEDYAWCSYGDWFNQTLSELYDIGDIVLKTSVGMNTRFIWIK